MLFRLPDYREKFACNCSVHVILLNDGIFSQKITYVLIWWYDALCQILMEYMLYILLPKFNNLCNKLCIIWGEPGRLSALDVGQENWWWKDMIEANFFFKSWKLNKECYPWDGLVSRLANNANSNSFYNTDQNMI